MESSEFDWRTVRVVYWDLGPIAAHKPIVQSCDDLKEDLAQVEFGAATLLDVGWYPSFSAEGRFVVSVVRNQRWDEPDFRLECRSVPDLYAAIRSAVAVAATCAQSSEHGTSQ